MNLRSTGIGTRAINFLIDTLIVFLIAFIAFKVYKWYVLYYHIAYYNFGWFFGGSILVYYSIFEGFFARTPGKWFSQCKVVNKDGSRPNIISVLIRSLIRLTIIDMFFIPFLNKTLHDYLSKTEVVQA
jgi:uncharacterized RDD family membrane protein YckC